MHSSKATQFRGQGFTLIELLIVLCILGICGAMTIASVGSQNDLLCGAAARSVMADCSYAQTRAMSLRKKVYIQRTGNLLTLLSRSSNAGPLTTLQHPISHDDYHVTFGAGGTTLSRVSLANWNFGTAAIIGFDELGCPFTYDATSDVCTPMTTTGSFTIASGAFRMNITLQPFTGDLTTD